MEPQVHVRLMGGFQVQGGSGPEGQGFESQKVRGLLAYLACHPGQSFSREHLSQFLWPEENAQTGRHNLRQALYSLRRGLGERADDLVVSDHRTLRLELGNGDHFDVSEMESAYQRGFPAAGEPMPAALGRVADLYRGDFLAGFTIRDSASFEDWLLTEQSRLRDMAMQAISGLVDHFSTRGEYEQAIAHCHRLLEIDPLSEEGHHELIRHYLLSGRRNRAVRHYQELEELLERELGVQPPAPTRTLYEGVQEGSGAFPVAAGIRPSVPRPRLPVAPFIPLVGREPLLQSLEKSWRQAMDRGARLALLEGETGIGKTRLARTILDRLSSQNRAQVVQGRCTIAAPWCGGHPVSGLLRDLEEAGTANGGAENAPSGGSGEPKQPSSSRLANQQDPGTALPLEERFFRALEERLAPGEVRRPPVVLFLDDLHLATVATCRTVGRLLTKFADAPLWILATMETADLSQDHPLRHLRDESAVETYPLERLADADLEALSDSLLGSTADCRPLAEHLMVASEGLPVATTEAINALWDLGVLTNPGGDHWSLDGPPEPAVEATPDDLQQLILRRVSELPTSTRRLLTLAAVAGVTFDVALLQHAAREHIGVVEIGLEGLLEHCLIRHYARRWHTDPRERDLVLWAQGTRRGSFEFAHPRIREALYNQLPPGRRLHLHGDLARTLAERDAPEDHEDPERVAFHFLAAEEPEGALPYLRQAAEAALRRGQPDTACVLARRGLDALTALAMPGTEARRGRKARKGRRNLETGRNAARGAREDREAATWEDILRRCGAEALDPSP